MRAAGHSRRPRADGGRCGKTLLLAGKQVRTKWRAGRSRASETGRAARRRDTTPEGSAGSGLDRLGFCRRCPAPISVIALELFSGESSWAGSVCLIHCSSSLIGLWGLPGVDDVSFRNRSLRAWLTGLDGIGMKWCGVKNSGDLEGTRSWRSGCGCP